ncbi:MAG: prephenate dehydrogenase [Candidatus Binataceae bacterium]
MVPLFRQITICGVGLIGGSLALNVRAAGLAERIVGFGRTRSNLEVARARGLADALTDNAATAARGADLVVLATPIMSFTPVLRAMIPYLPEEALITDVGSVKGWVVRELEALLGPGMALVGAHPIAGKETTGAAAADAALFAGRRVIVTPSARSTPAAVEKIETLWRATGARVERMTPELHDALLARASHLPQLAASALAAALDEERVEGRWAAEYGAGGLRDTTRIAASSAAMWRDICLTNREALRAAARLFRGVFEEFERALDESDGEALRALFERGRAMRERLP